MTTIVVPFHLDEHLPHFAPPVRTDVLVEPAELGRSAEDEVAVDVASDSNTWARIAQLQARVAAAVSDVVRAGGVPLVLSGDCVTALGTVAGLQHAEIWPGTIWFDGHGDVQTPQTSTSGYLGGMPLRQLLGEADRTVPDRLAMTPLSQPDVVLVDARDLDPAEREFLAGSQVRRVEVNSVPTPTGPIYLHVDVDVIDAAELPGVLFPAAGGPGAGAVRDAVVEVMSSGQVAAVGVACTWRPGAGAEAVVADLLDTISDLVAAR